MISFKQRGSFNKLERFFSNFFKSNARRIMESYGEEGVLALASTTPKDTGATAESYNYKITRTSKGYRLAWTTSNIDSSGTPIAILIEYGHGTSNGGYVQGRDFINPAIQPIFDKIAKDLWKEVTN